MGAHGLRYLNADTKEKLDALLKDKQPNNTDYDDNEEKRVIDNIETPYINKTNANEPLKLNATRQQQGTRTDHRATKTYNTTDVNSITPADGSLQKGQSIPYKQPVAPADHTNVAKPIHP